MRSPRENWTRQKLQQLANAISAKPLYFIFPQVLLAAFCLVYAVSNLKFNGTRADLISDEVKYQQQFRAFKREFQQPDALVAVVESESLEKNRRFVERLASKLKDEPRLFAGTYYKGDLRMMGNKALLFLSEETLEDLRRVIEREWAYIETHASANGLNAAVRLINQQFRESDARNLNFAELERALPVLRRTLEEAVQNIEQPLAHSFPGLAALFNDESRLYLSFAAGQMYVVVTHAAFPEVEEEAVLRLRELVAETSMEVPGVNAGISGEPVLNYDEMRQAQNDITLAGIYSFGIVALIFIYGFHETTRPLLATIALAVGIIYAIGFTTMTVGRLNILTITLVPILIGLAIDFGVHLISHYEESLKEGRTRRDALWEALPLTGIGILTSAFTTAGSFLAMVLTDFKGIQEMGFVSGMGLLLCVVPMLTLLPALLARERSSLSEAAPNLVDGTARQWLERIWLLRPKLIVAAAVLATALSLTQLHRVRFDYNLLNLQSTQLPAVGIEEKLIKSGSQSILYGVVVADSLEEAAEMQRKFEQLDLVQEVSSMVGLLTEDQQRKMQIIRDIKARAQQLKITPVEPGPIDIGGLNESLFALEGYLGLAIEELQQNSAAATILPEMVAVRNAVIRLRSLTATQSAAVVARLTEFEKTLFGTAQETIQIINEQDVTERLKVEDLPPFLRERFVSPSGKFLLQVHPKGDVWQRANQEQFIKVLRSVAPDVTGTLVQIYEYTSLIRSNFLRACGYAAAVIGVILLLRFRSPLSVLLALLPVALGLCWLIGVMGLLGLTFNPVNIMALTLLIGIGVANGIHILNRFKHDPRPGVLSRSTGKAVIVSALTTIAGFGSLMVAKHRGIASLGEIMAIGTTTCLIASIGLLPAILNLLQRSRKPAPPNQVQDLSGTPPDNENR